jgi:protein gp37
MTMERLFCQHFLCGTFGRLDNCDEHPMMDLKIKESIADDMEEHGFDESKPIDVWKEEIIVLDGHTRLAAAEEKGFETVFIHYHSFPNVRLALEYAIHNQRDRRNFTDADIMRCVEVLDKRNERGGDHGNQYADEKVPKTSNEVFANNTNEKNSATKTAKVVGTSHAKVEKARTVLDHADDKTKEEVKSGQKTINKAYAETQDMRKTQKEAKRAVFNKTNDSIEWAPFSWNPVTGCKHDCQYCYARDIAMRYTGHFNPAFHPNRLAAPDNTKLPLDDAPGMRNVFVCSMADLFGEWVPQEWIDSVLNTVRASPEWTFLFLTKNPKRMIGIDWPNNSWVGTTVDVQGRVDGAERAFREIDASVKFLSCEPLQEPLIFSDLSVFDWLIIGGRSSSSKMPAFQPDWMWVEDLLQQARKAKLKVYFKPNLQARPKEFPEVKL